jgi:CheY-like chemotaxis protein
MTHYRQILWVDDDGKDRFPFEIDCLKRIGWHINWAESAEEAVEKLLEKSFDLVLLDQVFPFEKDGRHKDVWSGCRLLYWLRGRDAAPHGAPPHDEWARLAARKPPQNGNRDVMVIVISAFQDDDVDAALKTIRLPPKLLPKPVDEDLLLELVRQAPEISE